MAFMMKKKKYKFTVHLCLEEITAVPFVNGVLFAKVRLLDGGNFMETSSREEVEDHKVKWGAKFEFVCKMSANASTGVLDPCMLRVSVRKEQKGGRSFQKLGFTDLNLAEFAGCGQAQRKCLLEGYDTRRRQDNSMLSVSIRMNMLAGDILFKVPSPTTKHKLISGEPAPSEEPTERREDFSGGSIASTSSGFSSLTKKRPPLFPSELVSGENEEPPPENCGGGPLDEGLELGHSRNSSNTSQLSKGSGYGSLNSQHSRQSSSGDSGHIRLRALHRSTVEAKWIFMWFPSLNLKECYSLSKAKKQLHLRSLRKVSESCKLCLVTGDETYEGIDQVSSSTITRVTHINNGVPVEAGSLDRGKAALERRKKAAEEGPAIGRVEFTRVNPNSLIDQILKATNISQEDESNKTSGLQLFIAKDGTTALGSQEVKSHMSTGVFKQVVIEENSISPKSPVEKHKGLKNGRYSSMF